MHARIWIPALLAGGFVSPLVAQQAEPAAPEAAVQLKAVVVSGEIGPEPIAKDSSTATKTGTPLIEVPQSVSVVTRDEIDRRGAVSVTEALRYTAGVTAESAGMDSRVDDVNIRGFDASSFSNNIFVDGLRLPQGGQWTRPAFDAYLLDRIEVLKGPSAVLYGQVSPGGLVNMVSKRPGLQGNEVSLRAASFAQWQAAFDLGGSLDADETVLYRLNGMTRDGDAQIQHTELGRDLLAPSLLWKIGEATTLTLLGHYQRDEGGATFQFLPMHGTLIATDYGRIERDTFLGEPGFNTFDRKQYAAGYSLEHRFSETFSAVQNFRYTHLQTLYETLVGGTDVQADQRTLARRMVRGTGESDSLNVDTRLLARYATGALRHVTLFGFDYMDTDWQHKRVAAGAGVPTIDVYDPVYGGLNDLPAQQRVQSDYDTSDRQNGFYLQDQIALGDWRATLGGRFDRFDTEQYDRASDTRDDNNNEAFTWRGGITYLAPAGLAPYASYATSFEPVGGNNNTEQSLFDPTEGEQVEAGLKWQPRRFDALFTLAAYELRQQNVLTGDPNAPQADPDAPAGSEPPCVTDGDCQIQAGEIRIRGIELEARAALAQDLTLIVALTEQDSEISKDNDPTLRGRGVNAVPKRLASVWLDYRLQGGPLAGLGFGGGLRYVGERYGFYDNITDAQNPVDRELPSYTLVDLTLNYDLGRALAALRGAELAINASNVDDKTYVASCTGVGSCFYGSGRVVAATLRYRW